MDAPLLPLLGEGLKPTLCIVCPLEIVSLSSGTSFLQARGHLGVCFRIAKWLS